MNTVNTSRGSVVSQVITTISTSIVQTGVVKRELVQARMSETVSKLNVEVPDIEGSLYDRAMGSCQSSKGTERPYYYDNPFGVEPIEVYYKGEGQRGIPLPELLEVIDIYGNIGEEITTGSRGDISKYSIYFTPKLTEEMTELYKSMNSALPPTVDVATNIQMLQESFSLLNGVMIGINFANTYAEGVNEKGMSNEEALIYGGVVTGAGVLGSKIGVTIAGVVLGNATGVIPLVMAVGLSISIGRIMQNTVKNLYDKYEPKVYEVLDNTKEFFQNSWNNFSQWVNGIFLIGKYEFVFTYFNIV